MGKPMMKLSRKGAKDNRTKLVWSKYFNYIVQDKEYYFKQKAYATYCDGWINSETIKKQTYKNALKRGNDCLEVLLKENIIGVPGEFLESIFSRHYGISKSQANNYIDIAARAIIQIKRYSTMGITAEYRIFIRILEYHVKLAKKVKQNEM